MGLILEEARKRPLLQVALDLIDIEKAKNIAFKVVEAGADIIEVGTPLLKSFGLLAVKELKTIARNKFILADLKTVDAFTLEFEPYINEGVNAVTILGLVDDDILKEAYEFCESRNVDLVIDMIYVPNPVERALRLADYGIEIVNIHIGVDVQRRRGVTAKQLLKEVEELARSGIVVSIAGGIKPEEVDKFIEYGARIIVIGSAITKSPNPYEATRAAVEKIKASSIHI